MEPVKEVPKAFGAVELLCGVVRDRPAAVTQEQGKE